MKNIPKKNALNVFNNTICYGYVVLYSSKSLTLLMTVFIVTIEGPNLNTFLVIDIAVIND